jgi:hypothetical protein
MVRTVPILRHRSRCSGSGTLTLNKSHSWRLWRSRLDGCLSVGAGDRITEVAIITALHGTHSFHIDTSTRDSPTRFPEDLIRRPRVEVH